MSNPTGNATTETPGTGSTVSTADQWIMRVMDERDRSYQQQFHAQEKAIEAAFHAQEKAVSAALSAAERAVIKAELASEKRFDAVNEFRGTLTDQNATFLPRPEFDRAILALYDKVDMNTKLINDQMDAMQTYRDRTSGKADGMQAGWVILLGLVGLVGSLITIVLVLKK